MVTKIITKRPNGTVRIQHLSDEPGKADQSFKKECDVNNIIAKFKKTRDPALLKVRQGHYADVSQIPDLHTAYIQVAQASAAFATVPAELRARLNEDPVEFVKYLNDPKNDKEAVKYGLKSRRVVEEQPAEPQPKGGSSKKQKSQTETKSDPPTEE